jgi:ribosomal protein L11 methyltransferase
LQSKAINKFISTKKNPMTLQFQFSNIKKPQADILLALLSSAEFDAFEETENGLTACIAEENFDQEIFEECLATMSPTPVFTKIAIPQTNWNAQWESNYEPIIVNEKVAIRATFHDVIESSELNIVIVPKMSFGTGHHATTQMMMEFISEMPMTEKRILDYGCGTGVLAIYACKKNAKQSLSIDIDEWCVTNTIENNELNDVKNNTVLQADIHEIEPQTFDGIFANINLHILQKQMQTFYQLLEKGGFVLLSGFLQSDEVLLEKTIQTTGFTRVGKKSKLNWSALHIVK